MQKISKKTLISYSFGDFGCCLINMMIGFYLSFYCSVFLEIPLAVIGTMLLVVQIWDAVNDIMIGNMIDRTRTKEGKARPWIKWFMLPCCISGALVFACPLSLSITGRTVWVFITYFLFVLFYTTINLPYSSMLSLIAKEQDDRAKLTTSRYIGAYLGQLIVFSSALPLIRLIGGDEGRAEGYRIVMIVFSALALVLFFLLYKNCPEIDCGDNFPLKPNEIDNRAEKISIKEFLGNLKILAGNKAWLLVILIITLYWIRYPFYGNTMTYYYRFALGLDETFSSIPSTLGIVAGIVVLPFVPKVVRKFGYVKTLVGSFIGCAAVFILGFIFPENLYVGITAITLDYGLETFQLTVTLSMVADSLDYGYALTGKKMSGLGYAVNTFASKAGPALAGFLVTLILSASGLDTTAAIGAPQPSSAVSTLKIVFWIIPAILALVLAFISPKYPTKKIEETLGRS